MLTPIIFWGASGHAKVLHEFMRQTGFEVVAPVDNQPGIPSPLHSVPVLHGKEGLLAWMHNQQLTSPRALVAIGGARGKDRLDLQNWLSNRGFIISTVIHPTAFVAGGVALGAGSQALAQSAIGVESAVGSACIINTAASVDHECVLRDGVHIGPGATLAGCVEVGAFSFVGAGAVVLPRLRIGAHSIVGAGAVVTKDVPDNVVVFGNPARIIRQNV